ncbi:MAG: DUF1513 domain-containing protein [Geminicoccaceae bacterium]
MKAVDRRTVLVATGGGLLAALGLTSAEVRGDAGPLFVACHADSEDRHHVASFEPTGHCRFDLPLPARGHAMAFAESRSEMVVFARRPGRFDVVIDYGEGVALHRIDAPDGRQFYGHGAFADGDRLLLATENDYASGDGVIGLYDAADGYRRVGEYHSHGIGPHELVLMPDGKTLAIANGGIRTHPERGRAKLNLDTMAPSLVFADLEDGKRVEALHLPAEQHKLSIRHLAILSDGRLALAMQYEGSKRDNVPLVALADGSSIQPLLAPDMIQRQMRHYAGSVAVDRSGQLIAISAPRGGLVTFWDVAERQYIGNAKTLDGSGVASGKEPGSFVVTSGNGDVLSAKPFLDEFKSLEILSLGQARWDNHLRSV